MSHSHVSYELTFIGKEKTFLQDFEMFFSKHIGNLERMVPTYIVVYVASLNLQYLTMVRVTDLRRVI